MNLVPVVTQDAQPEAESIPTWTPLQELAPTVTTGEAINDSRTQQRMWCKDQTGPASRRGTHTSWDEVGTPLVPPTHTQGIHPLDRPRGLTAGTVDLRVPLVVLREVQGVPWRVMVDPDTQRRR